MKNWLSRLFPKKQPLLSTTDKVQEAVSTTLPKPAPPPAPPNTATQVASLLKIIGYVHSSPEVQATRRSEGYAGLSALGNAAVAAIPQLIGKLFSTSAEERDLAKDTLTHIDPAWPENNRATQQIPFLLKKLEKEHWESKRAFDILVRMGAIIHDPLLAVFQDTAQDDPGIKATALPLLCKTGAPASQLYPFIQTILEDASSHVLLEAGMDAVQVLGKKDDTIAGLLAGMLEHKNDHLREKAIGALRACAKHPESIIPGLFKCLGDSSLAVRDNAVGWLSELNSESTRDLLKEVVANKGELKEEELKAMFQKMEFWLGESVTKSYQVNTWQFWNNLSWYGLELKNELERRKLFLESCLRVLGNLKYADSNLAEPVMEIYRKHNSTGVQIQCIRLLGLSPADTVGVLPFLMHGLENPHEKVRQEAITSMHQMDPNWISRPDMQVALRALIEQLDGNQRLAVREALLSLGALTASALSEYLEQTKNWAIQQAIIDILGHLDNNSSISLGTLQRVLASCQNTHTREALSSLIKQLEGGAVK